MQRFLILGVAIMVIAEGILVTMAPVMAILSAAALLVVSVAIRRRHAFGRRISGRRQAWLAPGARSSLSITITRRAA
jgi:hypothetical protein